MKVERSLPYFKALMKAHNNNRMAILHSFPKFVVDDLIEVLMNIVMGRVKVGAKHKKILSKHRKVLLNMANTKSIPKLRRIVFNQRGGFFPLLVPIAVSVISALVGGAIKNAITDKK